MTINKHVMGLIYKPLGVSSFKSLSSVKKHLSQKKVGHMGTLDPLAEGCLPFASGGLTSLIPIVNKIPKVYEVEIYFGVSSKSVDFEFVDSDSLDFKKINFDIDQIKEFLNSLIPKYSQIPPNFSAKHINGKRAYELARSGEDFELPSKDVDFFSYKVLSVNDPVLKLEISCGEGFYVRSLVIDIAKHLNLDAFMYSLKRTKVGLFELNNLNPGEIQILDLKHLFPEAFYSNLNQKEFENLKFGIAPKFSCQNQIIFAFYEKVLVYFSYNLDSVLKQKFLINS